MHCIDCVGQGKVFSMAQCNGDVALSCGMPHHLYFLSVHTCFWALGYIESVVYLVSTCSQEEISHNPLIHVLPISRETGHDAPKI